MKNITAYLMLALFSFSCGNSPEMSKADLEKEKRAIMQVIENETEAFFRRDYKDWTTYFAHTDYAFQAWSNRDGTFDHAVGWNDINSQLGRYIADNPDATHPLVERKNMIFKFYHDNVAYMVWDQFNSDPDGQNFLHSKEVRLLEKIDGEWKIVCVSAFWDHKNLIPADKLPQIQKMYNESRGKGKI